jgi:hypothetical protein
MSKTFGIFARYVSIVEERRGAYRVLIRKHEEKRPLGRHRHRWGDNIKVGLQEVGLYVDWLYPAQNKDRWSFLLNAVMKLRVP